MKCFYAQFYNGKFVSMKVISFTFFNIITFKDKAHIKTFSSRSLQKPKTIKNAKKKGVTSALSDHDKKAHASCQRR